MVHPLHDLAHFLRGFLRVPHDLGVAAHVDNHAVAVVGVAQVTATEEEVLEGDRHGDNWAVESGFEVVKVLIREITIDGA